MSTKTGTVVELGAGGILALTMQVARTTGQIAAHRIDVGVLAVHVAAEQVANEAGDTDLLAGGLEASPTSGLVVEGEGEVAHRLSVKLALCPWAQLGRQMDDERTGPACESAPGSRETQA